MKKFVVAVAVLIFAIPALAQVQAPDYTDVSKWKYVECDMSISPLKDKRCLTFHEDYIPANEDVDTATKAIQVWYQPLERKVLEEEFERGSEREAVEKFINVSKKHSWILVYFMATDMNTRKGDAIHVFEYKNNSWKLRKTFDSDDSEEDYFEFIRREYKIK